MGTKVPGRAACALRMGLSVLAAAAALGAACQDTWWRTYGGAGVDGARCVRTLGDGGAYLAGSTGSFGTDGDAYVIRIDAQGQRLWSAVLGGPGTQAVHALAPSADGCFAAGITWQETGDYDGWLARITAAGEVAWQRAMGSGEWDWFNGLEADGAGLTACGVTYASGRAKGWLVRTDLQGEVLWEREMMSGDAEGEAHGLAADGAGGWYVAGTLTADAGQDAFAARIGPDGQQQWLQPVGTDSVDTGQGLCRTADGGMVLTGATRGFRTHPQLLLAKLTQAGQLLWLQHWGEEGEFGGAAIVQRADGGFAVAGHTGAYGGGGLDFFLLRAHADGGYDEGRTYGGEGTDRAYGIAPMPDGGYILAGITASFGPGPQAVFAVRTDSLGGPATNTVIQYNDPVGVREREEGRGLRIAPNPVGAAREVEVRGEGGSIQGWRLLDLLGAEAASGPGGADPCRIALHGLPAGCYLLSVQDAAGNRMQRRVVLE